MSQHKSKIILGIDPGTTVLGFGIIQISDKQITIIQHGVLNLKKYESHYEKLGHIYTMLDEVIKEYKPDEVSIEAPFFGKNVQSMLKLGRAQGVAIAVSLNNNLPIFEYAPKKIKKAVTGNGNATKESVASMVEKLTKSKINPKYLDSTDALGAALCHYYQNTSNSNKTKYSNWSDYANKNKLT